MKDRRHTFPLITGDGFRALADFWCDTAEQCVALTDKLADADSPIARRLKPGQAFVVFVALTAHKAFLDSGALARSSKPVVALVHNGDDNIQEPWFRLMDEPRLVAWFTQNCAQRHAKVVCVPIGLENRQFSMHGWIPEMLIGQMAANTRGLPALALANRTKLAFAAFSPGTYPSERGPLKEGMKHQAGPGERWEFVFWNEGNRLIDYHRMMADHAAVIAPRGNGLDTLRAWEALYLGRMVVTRTSALDPLWEGLPVLVLDRWDTLTAADIRAALARFASPAGRAGTRTEKLFMPYWACEVGRAAKREAEFCSLPALEALLDRRDEFGW